jgi:tetratricopeptide (TPR) repeat protein
MEFISSISNGIGLWLLDRRWNRAARMSYAVAVFFEHRNASAWYNRGLIAKFEARWADSLAFNRRATELDPANGAAWWNLGIAATAMADWPTARHAWSGFGVDVPGGDGPLAMNLGAVPIRLSPQANAEVVWARRIAPGSRPGVERSASGLRTRVLRHYPARWRTAW